MGRHAEAEFGHGLAPVRQQALPKGGVGPGLGDHASAILRDPLFFGEVPEFLDEFTGFHAAFVECRLDGVDALFDRCDGLMDVVLVGHDRHSQVI